VDQSAVVCLAVLFLAGCSQSPEARIRATLASQTTGKIQLPSGIVEISSELALAPGAHDLEIAGNNTRLKAADNFHGRALLVMENAQRIRIHDVELDGNRDKLDRVLEMAPPENAFRVWYPNNGVLADHVTGLEIQRLKLAKIVNFPILVSQSKNVRIGAVGIADSGSKNARGRNNLSGGILLEDGVTDFEVRESTFSRVLGNGLWTHSQFNAPRQEDGVFTANVFDTIGRDAILVGHATRVRVENNSGVRIGYPSEAVDIENGGIPIAMDTAGDVDHSGYLRNTFEEIDGQCVNLDGFHDGSVSENRCSNRKAAADYPFGSLGMAMNNTHPNAHSNNIEISGNLIDGSKFGGLFLMGSGNRIIGNRFLRVNLAGCNESAGKFACVYKADEPEMLNTGVYLGRGVARLEETRGNVIRDNRISGHGMRARCIGFGPGVARAGNTVENNTCSDEPPAR
jgi:parallel beta-helix repeat protein